MKVKKVKHMGYHEGVIHAKPRWFYKEGVDRKCNSKMLENQSDSSKKKYLTNSDFEGSKKTTTKRKSMSFGDALVGSSHELGKICSHNGLINDSGTLLKDIFSPVTGNVLFKDRFWSEALNGEMTIPEECKLVLLLIKNQIVEK